MLIRISGGKAGIVEYLRTGRKQGRKESRMTLDERVTLLGDLDTVDRVTNSMTTKAERYLHITLSFREDFIPKEVLRKVAQEFKDFALCAYPQDDALFYAEAHLPRLKATNDVRTQKPVERFPHIHVVIPKVNLLSGTALNPFGMVNAVVDYVDAFQEMINHKYGFESPKDHPRIVLTDRTDILSRSKGDTFEGLGRELKESILHYILEGDVKCTEDLHDYLCTLGDVKIRNPGTERAYFNLKLPGEPKGINLKDLVFGEDFLSLPREKKQSQLGIRQESEGEIGPGNIPPKIQRTLQEWHTTRAMEVRYLNSGNKSQWKRYHEADENTKTQMLKTWEEGFYKKYLPNTSLIPDHFKLKREEIETKPIKIAEIHESELGQRIKDTLTQKVSKDLTFIVSRRFRISSWERLWADLETNHGLSKVKIAEHRKSIFTPQAQLEFLTEQMHWEPRTAWRYLKRFGSFQNYRDPSQGQTWVKLREKEAMRRKELWDTYLKEKKRLFENPAPPGLKKKSQYAILQLGFVLTSQKLWAHAHVERTQYFDRTISAQDSLNKSSWTDPITVKNCFPIDAPWIFRVERTGSVSYWRYSKLSLTDTGNRVKIHDESDMVLETALRLAVLKFGTKLQVEGSEEFQFAIARTAARMNLKVSLGDPALDALMEELDGVKKQVRNDGMAF